MHESRMWASVWIALYRVPHYAPVRIPRSLASQAFVAELRT